jgi:hypothetical protein
MTIREIEERIAHLRAKIASYHSGELGGVTGVGYGYDRNARRWRDMPIVTNHGGQVSGALGDALYQAECELVIAKMGARQWSADVIIRRMTNG